MQHSNLPLAVFCGPSTILTETMEIGTRLLSIVIPEQSLLQFFEVQQSGFLRSACLLKPTVLSPYNPTSKRASHCGFCNVVPNCHLLKLMAWSYAYFSVSTAGLPVGVVSLKKHQNIIVEIYLVFPTTGNLLSIWAPIHCKYLILMTRKIRV